MKYGNKTNKLINILLKKNVKICAAESITGGRFAFEIIKNENASKIFDYGLVTYSDDSKSNILGLKDKINKIISEQIGPIAKLDKIQFTDGLPKTRSGKIMRRILRKIANNDISDLGDTSTLLNPEVVEEIILKSKNH